MPAAIPLATFATLTVAEAATELIPVLSRMLEEVGPKPIPSTPSTDCSKEPGESDEKDLVQFRSRDFLG